MQREYICVNCGLIWFDKKMSLNQGVTCPECGNDGDAYGWDKTLYACDTYAWFYATEHSLKILGDSGKKIHYHKDHPWHNKKED